MDPSCLKNNMKIKLLILLAIIAVFIGSFLLYTKSHAKKLLAENRDKCFSQGMARYDIDLKQKSQDVTLLNPRYFYNEITENRSKSTECIYIGGNTTLEGSIEEYIYDISSGERVTWYSYSPSKGITLGDKERFKELEEKYSIKY